MWHTLITQWEGATAQAHAHQSHTRHTHTAQQQPHITALTTQHVTTQHMDEFMHSSTHPLLLDLSPLAHLINTTHATLFLPTDTAIHHALGIMMRAFRLRLEMGTEQGETCMHAAHDM